MEYQHVLTNVEDHIMTVTLNRPKSLNALNSELLQELSEVIDSISKDDSVRAVIITGSGEKAFVAGADITEMRSKSPLEALEFSQRGNEILSKLEQLSVPVIGAINGYALGGGCELALACDIRIASENAKLGLPEVTLGVTPGFGGTQRLPRLVGIGFAKELMMTGNMIPAERALQIGLVNHVFPLADLLEKAKDMARKMAANSPLGVKNSKKLINEGMNLDLERALVLEAQTFSLLFSTEDQKEGMDAFLQKGSAEFKGK